MRRAVLAPSVVALVAAALLSGAAAYTVHQAGCQDPGRYELRKHGYELVGGCVEPGDLPVGGNPVVELDTNVDNPRP